ncbi:MAG TPA: DUF3883 domain-containing protein [Balneolaceae bacterium]
MADWTTQEVTFIVKDYFDMLLKELSGQDYNKSEHRRNLQKVITQRTEASIEFKHQNISAVLLEMGLPYIPGYKPLHKYQTLLRESVEDFLVLHPELEEEMSKLLFNDLKTPTLANILTSEVKVPDIPFKTGETVPGRRYKASRNFYKEELLNTRLGLLGEKFIISYEKERLTKLGLKSLANSIEHVSQTQGDSAGFDILSFDKNKKERFIEVKTTQMGKEAPFYFTRNELGFSKKQKNQYSLYRVFEFKKEPKFYQLKGSINHSCNSLPIQFMGWPKQ